MELIKICPGSFLLRVPDADIAWVFNAWPDTAKFIIQQNLDYNGIVYPDLRLQTNKGISCNLIEFPLLHIMFNKGAYFRGEKPCMVGTERQLHLASESFRRGLYGFYNADEMADCDLSEAEAKALMKEIERLALNGIQSSQELIEMVPLVPLEDCPTAAVASEYRGVRIWKEAINVFGVEWQGEQILIDCNLGLGEEYVPPLKIDVKNIPYKLYQIIDTGEEDGFSPKSCMHTVIQWREKIICIDLPMNVSYLLDKISISRTEIDAVIFTHNHDDHIGELAMLLQLDKKITVICPKIIWKSILLKASYMFDMSVEELDEYFDYMPIIYGEDDDFFGLRITAHPSIHPVPCAVYRIRGIVDGEWKVYSHMSDILNFSRCQTLVDQGVISRERFEAYKAFLLEPATVKKIDVGTLDGKEASSVHGSWHDFREDHSEHIVLGHIREEALDEKATVLVGQFAVAGSARDMSERIAETFQDKYRERAFKYLADYLFALLEGRQDDGLVSRQQILGYVRILADNEIRLIQPNTPFLKKGGKSTFIDMVISGVGSVWVEAGEDLIRVANVNAGDMIGDIGVLLQIPRTATIRADTYMYVLRIPGLLFLEIAIWLGIFPDPNKEDHGESVLQKIWRHRTVVQASHTFGAEVPVYLQNKIAQHAEEITLEPDKVLAFCDGPADLYMARDVSALSLEVEGRTLPPEVSNPPIFGEGYFLTGRADRYQVKVLKETSLLKLEAEQFAWLRDIPIFKLRLKQLTENREIFIHRALRSS
jgi:hypothetical protein